ncbi:MAG: hypothetical protein AB1779_08555 [Candidatus Thermoplasmatota archaeon]
MKDNKGQEVFMDAMLFFIIAIIASSIIFIYSMNIKNVLSSRAEKYPDEAIDVLLLTNISTSEIKKDNNTTTIKNDTPLLIAIKIYLSKDREGGYELSDLKSAIKKNLDLGISQNYQYALHAKFDDGNGELFISEFEKIPKNRWASSRDILIDEHNAKIVLYIWD